MSSNRPWSEQYRLAGQDWAQKDGAARMLEDGKSAFLAQKIAVQGDIAHNKAETAVKSSEEWADYIKKMVHAKTAANLARVEMEFMRMRFTEWNSLEANKRAEMKL